MKTIGQTFVAGFMVILPFAVTVWAIVYVGRMLDDAGLTLLGGYGDRFAGYGLGVVIVLGAIFLVGLLTRLWLFKWSLTLADRLFRRVPGVKTIYESVRDLLKLFSAESEELGRVVLYCPPETGLQMLAILTTDTPAGSEASGRDDMVALYLPMAYMIGGPIAYVPREHVREVDISVESAMKLCATAQVGFRAPGVAARRLAEGAQADQPATDLPDSRG